MQISVNFSLYDLWGLEEEGAKGKGTGEERVRREEKRREESELMQQEAVSSDGTLNVCVTMTTRPVYTVYSVWSGGAGTKQHLS